MGGTGELGLYGYLGTCQSRPGWVTCCESSAWDVPTLPAPVSLQVPSTQVLPARLYQQSTYARTDGKL